MSDESADEGVHNELLDEIRELDKPPALKKSKRLKLKKSNDKVNLNELLGTIKSTRNVDELKKQLKLNKIIEKPQIENYKGRKRVKVIKIKKNKVLQPPLHRLAEQRIESKIVYKDLKKDLHQWNPIVHKNRIAEQISFPLDDIDFFNRVELAADKSKGFELKTELEKLTAEILGQSKFNITNDNPYCEAEKEIIKAMSLKEARKKCQELQKIRALTSYKAVKMKQQSKIKSKQYHRIKKREERRKLLKEIEQLIVKDPEQAKEKFKKIEKDRTFERATLKHRSGNRWSRQIEKFASRNPELRKLVEEHFRLGRELKSNSELIELNELEDKIDNFDENKQTVDQIVEAAAEEANKQKVEPIPIVSTKNPFLQSAIEAIREERKILLEKAKLRGNFDKKPDSNIIFNEKPLFLENQQIINLPDDLVNNENDYEQEMQENFLAEAYADDDVFGEFIEEKKRVEEEEQPKIIDLNLNGWGSWTGPGIIDKKNEKFIIKPKEVKRKDKGHPTLIIRETVSKELLNIQPRDIPFPFTSIEDYQAYIEQPLGRDWNSEISQKMLIKPKVITKAGRIICPLDKETKARFYDSEED